MAAALTEQEEVGPKEAWFAHDAAASRVVEYLKGEQLAAQPLVQLCQEAQATYEVWRGAVNTFHYRIGRPPYCGSLRDYLKPEEVELCKFPPDELRRLFLTHAEKPHLFPDMFGEARDGRPVQIAGSEETAFNSTFWGRVVLDQFDTLSPAQIRTLEHLPQMRPGDIWMLLLCTHNPQVHSWDAVEKLGEALSLTQAP